MLAPFPSGVQLGSCNAPERATRMAAIIFRDTGCSELIPRNSDAFSKATQQPGTRIEILDILGFAMRLAQPEPTDTATRARAGSETPDQAFLNRLRREVEEARWARVPILDGDLPLAMFLCLSIDSPTALLSHARLCF